MSTVEPITFAGSELGDQRHICAFFNTPSEEYRLTLPFIKDGLERGERAFHIVGPAGKDDHRRRLESAGVRFDEIQRKGQLEVRTWEQAYLRDGRFNQHAMLSLIQEVLEEGTAKGFPLTRLVAHMQWALEDRPGVADLLEYETRLNYVLPKYKDPVVCTYDATKFSASLVLDILRTHPTVLVGGTLHVNPFYVQPDELLKEITERKGAR